MTTTIDDRTFEEVERACWLFTADAALFAEEVKDVTTTAGRVVIHFPKFEIYVYRPEAVSLSLKNKISVLPKIDWDKIEVLEKYVENISAHVRGEFFLEVRETYGADGIPKKSGPEGRVFIVDFTTNGDDDTRTTLAFQDPGMLVFREI